MSFIPDRIDRHAFDVQFEQELEQAVNSGLVRNYSHEMRVAIGAIAGVKSVDSREDGRAQYSADDYLEFFGGQRMPFQYYASRGERNESQCLRWTRLLAELTTKQAVPIARMHGCFNSRSIPTIANGIAGLAFQRKEPSHRPCGGIAGSIEVDHQ